MKRSVSSSTGPAEAPRRSHARTVDIRSQAAWVATTSKTKDRRRGEHCHLVANWATWTPPLFCYPHDLKEKSATVQLVRVMWLLVCDTRSQRTDA